MTEAEQQRVKTLEQTITDFEERVNQLESTLIAIYDLCACDDRSPCEQCQGIWAVVGLPREAA